MQRSLPRKLKIFASICLFTSLAGVLYQLINEYTVNYNSVVVGFPLGVIFGVLELFLFPKAYNRLQHFSFTKMLLFKTVVCTAAIFLVTIVLVIIQGLFNGRSIDELQPYLASMKEWVLIIYTLVIYGLLLLFLQINNLLGQGVLLKFVRGRYHKPREEERIFMFLDMKASTRIAEELGHVKFYTLLNELFHEISQPVLQTKAEIYQYVGDEVVLTWELRNGLENSNCLMAYFLFKESLQRNSNIYFNKFGVRPEFKAGLHFGKVVSAQIGDLKREIIYNGDVVNTTARIQDECNTYQKDCLVSGDLMNRLPLMNGYKWEKIATVILRGKENEVELFSVSNISFLKSHSHFLAHSKSIDLTNLQ
jgi:adenylate cyclase